MLSEIETGRIYSATPAPFLSRRFSFNFSIVALLQRKYYPRGFESFIVRKIWEGRGGGGEFERNSSNQTANIYLHEGKEGAVNRSNVFLEYWILEESEIFRWKRMAFRRGENIFRIFKRHDRIISRVIYSLSYQRAKRFISRSVLGLTEGTRTGK